MRELNVNEVESCAGGVALLAPVAVALADTGGWTAISGAFAAGYSAASYLVSQGGTLGTPMPSYLSPESVTLGAIW